MVAALLSWGQDLCVNHGSTLAWEVHPQTGARPKSPATPSVQMQGYVSWWGEVRP